MELKEVERQLEAYVRPLTFPVALRMLRSEEEIPERTRRPVRDMKKRVAICQGIGMARKLGWAVAMGRLGCATIITAMKNDACRYLIPGNGDRIFGMAQDNEMAFFIPASWVERVIEGLVETHKRGVRYPITSFFDFEATLPPSYEEQMRLWEEEGER